jgi:hypothetical protein
MWEKTADGSIEDKSGKVIYFSATRFERDIGLGGCCFICGAQPNQKPFNNEHVLPEWLLRRYSLFDRKITLPNEQGFKYGNYTVPCCIDCNSLMGEYFETPISNAVREGAASIRKLIGHDPLRVYAWLALIYLKTHLKDRSLRVHLDQRKGAEKIADEYDWSELHHLHCIARYFYSGAEVEPEALGSFLVMETNNAGMTESFDYSDLYLAQTATITLDGTVIFAVMNDSGGAISNYTERLDRITGPLSHIQSKEMMADLALLNLHLKERTVFRTEFDMINERCRILASRPGAPELVPIEPETKGKIMLKALAGILPHMKMAGFKNEAEIAEAISSGHMSFLFDDSDKFITESFKPAL